MQMDKVLELQAVLLRNHPQMSYKGVPSWPPSWVWIGGAENKNPKGEVGILQRVNLSMIPPRCYVVTEYEGAEYMGCLLFDDRVFSLQIYHLLEDHRGYPVHHIGGLDLGHTL